MDKNIRVDYHLLCLIIVRLAMMCGVFINKIGSKWYEDISETPGRIVDGERVSNLTAQ